MKRWALTLCSTWVSSRVVEQPVAHPPLIPSGIRFDPVQVRPRTALEFGSLANKFSLPGKAIRAWMVMETRVWNVRRSHVRKKPTNYDQKKNGQEVTMSKITITSLYFSRNLRWLPTIYITTQAPRHKSILTTTHHPNLIFSHSHYPQLIPTFILLSRP